MARAVEILAVGGTVAIPIIVTALTFWYAQYRRTVQALARKGKGKVRRLEKRLAILERKVAKHTELLTKTTVTNGHIIGAQVKQTDDVEEIQDAINNLSTNTAVLKQRMDAHDDWRRVLDATKGTP